MLTRIDLRGDRSDASDRLPRAAAADVAAVRTSVAEIVDAVAAEGDEAVARFSERFDGFGGTRWEVGLDEAKAALEALDPGLRTALERAAERIGWFHERARPQDWREDHDGVVLGVRHRPLRRVACYVPGGRAPLISSALMTVIPAKVAGVDDVVVVTPPGRDGHPDQGILAAAVLAGADRILRIGGAQAVAAVAYGTATVPRCDKVVGPGNAYVAEAKALVSGRGIVGVDGFNGVTEIAILADLTADPRHVAIDLIAQAEHDPAVTALLITPSLELASGVEAVIGEEVARARHADRIETALRGQGAIVLVDDLDHAVEVADAFAAEHLQIQTEDAVGVAERVRAAGAIFVGSMTPVPLGDYAAGPNHTLPTGGTARFAGGLRTDDFLLPVNWLQASAPALRDLSGTVATIADAEDLPAHRRAVDVRLDGG